jgi:hypothetical protein
MRKLVAVVPLVALAFAACSDSTTPTAVPGEPVFLTSAAGVKPSPFPGNFVASDNDQVCYALDQIHNLGLTGDLRGIKVDIPAVNTSSDVSVTIHSSGRLLDWVLNSGTMHGVIVKGGPNYNFYNYVGTGHMEDQGLSSPMHGRNRPAISHYNICYTPDFDPAGSQGCTPGYWRNHADRWVGVSSADDFDTTFGVDLFDPNVTLGWAIWASGGGNNAFARHATAALLNAHAKADGSLDQFVDYPYTVAVVIQMVQDAVANDTIEATKNLFEAANELGCPLSGTRAVPVS